MLKNKQINMKKKQLLIIAIIVVLAVVACLTAYMLVNSQPESLNTLRISDSCTVEVPVDNNTVQNLNDGIKLYSFETHSLNITHEKNSNNSEIRELFSNLTKNCEKKEDNIYYDSSTGIYSTFIENSATGDGLIISSSDLDLLKRVSASLKFKIQKQPILQMIPTLQKRQKILDLLKTQAMMEAITRRTTARTHHLHKAAVQAAQAVQAATATASLSLVPIKLKIKRFSL